VRTAALALALILSACSQPSARVLDAEAGRFRVAVPNGWDAQATDPADWIEHRTVAILSSQTLDPQCAASSSRGGCSVPVNSLADGSVLVWWLSAICAGAGCDPPEGERVLVGGRQASKVGGSHLCDALGATREQAYFVTVSPQRMDVIVACDRAASEATMAQLQDMLEHVSWRTP
jgi:hypothetical protein